MDQDSNDGRFEARSKFDRVCRRYYVWLGVERRVTRATAFSYLGRRFILGLLGSTLALIGARAALPYQPVPRDPLLEPWRWRSFADMNGLETQCVAETKNGTIWFGTADGLSSYDGFEWKRHLATDGGILAGWVTGLCSEPDGALVAGGWWGISQFKDGLWTRLIPAVGLRFADVRRLAVAPDGSLWAATSWGALRRQQSTWTLYTDEINATRLEQDERYRFLRIERLPAGVLARARPTTAPANRADLVEVAVDPRGRVWFGTKGGEILRCAPAVNEGGTKESDAWALYNEADGLGSGRVPNILALRDGTVWVASASASQISVFAEGTWRALPLPAPGLAGDGARMIQTSDGVAWVSARYVLYAWRQGQWHTYRKPEVPIPTAQNLLLQSQDGALWIAGPSTDLHRVDYQTTRWVTLEQLNFQWESKAGVRWFLERDGRAVMQDGGRWTSYGVEDGMIDAPVTLVGTRNGSVWAAGSHERTAAVARFDGEKWTREALPNFAWGIDWRAVFEAADGSMWFGAAVDSSGPKSDRAGLLQFRDGRWLHHHQPGRSPRPDGREEIATLLPASHRPEPIEKFTSIGESRDGRIWAGRNVLAFHDDQKWTEFFPNAELRFGIIESILTTREREVWIGTRQYGALRYDGSTWRKFQGKGNLLANSVRSFAEAADGSVWAATDRGLSRFDGQTWTDDVLPAVLGVPHEGGSLRTTPTGALWINRTAPDWNRRAWSSSSPPDLAKSEFWTIAFWPTDSTPRTVITTGVSKVASPGNLSISWTGVAPWREPRDARLQYSYRLDGGPWSAFTPEHGHTFVALPSGPHHFEVRARTEDFVVDPKPATLDFMVMPPVWQQGWFVLLMVTLVGATVVQTIRVVLEHGRLRRANRELAAEIAARVRTDTALRDSEQRFRQVTESMEEVFWLEDAADGRIIYLSPAFERVWKQNREERYAHAQQWPESIHPDDRARVSEASALRHAAGDYDLEYRIVRPDGEVRWIHDRAFPVRDGEGRLYRFAGVAEDITAHRELEGQLRQAQKMESLGTLAGGIAHDFNNILTGILGSAEVAKLEIPKESPARPWVEEVLKAGVRAKNLVQQILTFGRKHESRLMPRKIQCDVTDAVKLIRSSIPATIQIDSLIDENCPSVVADPTQIHQIVMNLCTNAWHALPPTGGRIEVALAPVTVTAAMAATRLGLRLGRQVLLTVRDNGKGMTPETLLRIFEPFFTTKAPGVGTGLGLAVVHGIVQSHHGLIFVQSAPGKGTCFEVFLPEVALPESEAIETSELIIRGRGGLIMVIDDDPIALTALSGQLARIGYQVQAFGESSAALAFLKAHPDGFDLVLSDNAMPGLNGRAVADRIRVLKPGLPVLLISGVFDQNEIEAARECGVRELIRKPVTLAELSQIVARYVGGSAR